MQAILQTATTHGASPSKPLPINTAYICWQLARQEQLAGILSMLAGVLGVPCLPPAFMTALVQLGKESAAATLSDLAQVRHRYVSEAASLTSAMTSVTIIRHVAVVVVVIVAFVVAAAAAVVVVIVIVGVVVVVAVKISLIAWRCLLWQDNVVQAHSLSLCT